MVMKHGYYDREGERDRFQLLEDTYRRLGTRKPQCSHSGCTEADPFAMTGTHPHIYCYEHRMTRADRPQVEAHHPAGQHNQPDVTTPVPGNDHRVLSSYQWVWPEDTLLNPDASPLVRAAACIRGWLDVLWIILMRTVGWIPQALEELDKLLRGWIDTEWWVTIGWNPT